MNPISKRILSILLVMVMCLTTLPGTAFAQTATEPPTEPAPVCDCGTDDVAIHAANCAVYVAPEMAVCYCTEKCTEVNVWCDVCGFDISKCGGEDTATVYDAITSGTCGDSLTWEITLNKDGTTHTLTISGSGAMADYEVDILGFSNSPWSTYITSITDISLPEGLTSIGANAFYGCNALRELVIPGSVTTIGSRAIAPETNIIVHYLGAEGSVTLGTSAVCNISLFHYCENKEVVAATCAAAGHEAGWYCTDCQKYITGEETAIDPDNHNMVNGTCTVCGETQSVISVNITWGTMSFTYTDETGWTDNGTGWIEVENTGNTPVTVTANYENYDGFSFTGTFTETVSGNITKFILTLYGKPTRALNEEPIGKVTLTIE